MVIVIIMQTRVLYCKGSMF
ncbi:hypothetical protein F383_34004 [Gossypium arboreum]|uniref:Uncharacterized protein n=1 Tax=Gossypium arboreum TaxID=29729 RepID=A0A0B0N6V6_GOSAR|nr:hypothetical protein F383_35778 [Gossypium arboreum]KHG17808.1 hypothetical protein F383_21607 [Gossypium arboreum]KHG27488.1 hypothetical protein F383_34004 [Gossypium arboreum]